MSRNGKGRWVDNVCIERFWRSLKWEETYLKRYESVNELRSGVSNYRTFYNDEERQHSALSYRKPKDVYFG
ncbi:MAG: integrase core domain-containing protein [Planctomycetaceae bacterium]|nr:integrase core domain-containing protein [Planctomycetaceae bacterium]